MNFDDFSLLVTCFNKEKFVLNFVMQVEFFLEKQAKVLIIDDGSSDRSVELLAPILDKYENCRVIQTENRGSAAARNLTLNNLETEYFMFWDIDDDLDAENVSYALHLFKQTNADYAISNFVCLPEKTQGIMPKEVSRPEVIEIDSISPQILEAVGYWRYLYKKSVTLDKLSMRFVPTRNEIKNSRFILDDLFWILEVSLQSAKLLVFPPEIVTYKYRTHSIQSEDSWKKYQNQVVDFPNALEAFENYLNLKKYSRTPNRYKLFATTLIKHFGYLNNNQKIKFLLSLTHISLRNCHLLQMTLQIYPKLFYILVRNAIRDVLVRAKLL